MASYGVLSGVHKKLVKAMTETVFTFVQCIVSHHFYHERRRGTAADGVGLYSYVKSSPDYGFSTPADDNGTRSDGKVCALMGKVCMLTGKVCALTATECALMARERGITALAGLLRGLSGGMTASKRVASV
jgi:hypothetical protein